MPPFRSASLSRETKIGVVLSLLFHLALFGMFLLIRVGGPSSVPPLLISVETPEGIPSRSERRKDDRSAARRLRRKPILPDVERPAGDALAANRQLTDSTEVAQDTLGTVDSVETIRPRLTFAEAESLSRRAPHLRSFLLREAVMQTALAEDSARFALRLAYERSLSSLKLPDEYEGAARLHQRRFGTPYNPMRPPAPSAQIDLLWLVNTLVNAGRSLLGN